MSVWFTFGQERDVTLFAQAAVKFKLTRIKAWGLFVGNSFIGFARSLKAVQ